MIAKAYPAGPSPAATIMYPICDIVDAASAFLMSSFAIPIIAPKIRVIAPTITTKSCAVGAASKTKLERTMR